MNRQAWAVIVVSWSAVVGLVGGSPGAGGSGRPRLEAAASPVLSQPVAVVVDHGWAVVATSPQDAQTGGAAGPGRVTLLALRGAIRVAGSVTVGAGPVAVFLDDQGQHALTLNTGGGDKYHGFTGGSISLLYLHALEATPFAGQAAVRTLPLGRLYPLAAAADWGAGRLVLAVVPLPFNQGTTRTRLITLDLRTGGIMRTLPLDGVPTALAVDLSAGRIAAVTTVLAGGSTAQRPAARVLLLDARTGQTVRTTDVAGPGGPAVTDAGTGRLVVATAPWSILTPTLSVLDTRTGTLLRRLSLGQPPAFLADDAAHGRVIVATGGTYGPNDAITANGTVRLLDAHSGTMLATAPVGVPLTQAVTGWPSLGLAVDAAGTRIFVTDQSRVDAHGVWRPQGSVSALAVQGSTVRTVRTVAFPTGVVPLALAVDNMTRRVVVTTVRRLATGGGTPGVTILDERTGAATVSLSLAATP